MTFSRNVRIISTLVLAIGWPFLIDAFGKACIGENGAKGSGQVIDLPSDSLWLSIQRIDSVSYLGNDSLAKVCLERPDMKLRLFCALALLHMGGTPIREFSNSIPKVRSDFSKVQELERLIYEKASISKQLHLLNGVSFWTVFLDELVNASEKGDVAALKEVLQFYPIANGDYAEDLDSHVLKILKASTQAVIKSSSVLNAYRLPIWQLIEQYPDDAEEIRNIYKEKCPKPLGACHDILNVLVNHRSGK